MGNCNCSCSNNAEMVVMACSGACDLGEIADKLARKLRNNQVRILKCLAMVGAGKDSLIESLLSANLMVIDGCTVDCAKLMVEKAGISNFHYIRLTDYGYQKGNTPVTDETINKIYKDIESVC